MKFGMSTWKTFLLFQFSGIYRNPTTREQQKTCKRCKKNNIVFEGPKCRKEFGDWLFSSENENCIALAHNARGYDSQFLLRYLDT